MTCTFTGALLHKPEISKDFSGSLDKKIFRFFFLLTLSHVT